MLLSRCPWKEHKSLSNHAFFHNDYTKESVLTIPKDLQDFKDCFANENEASSSLKIASSATPKDNNREETNNPN